MALSHAHKCAFKQPASGRVALARQKHINQCYLQQNQLFIWLWLSGSSLCVMVWCLIRLITGSDTIPLKLYWDVNMLTKEMLVGLDTWRRSRHVSPRKEEHLTDNNIHGRRGRRVDRSEADEFLFLVVEGHEEHSRHVTGVLHKPQISLNALNAESQKHVWQWALAEQMWQDDHIYC